MRQEIRNNILFCSFVLYALCYMLPAYAELGSKVNENERKFGREIASKKFSDDNKNYSGKKVYRGLLYGWQTEVLYVNGRSVSEVARPKGDNFKKSIITEQEANVIADILYPKQYRGPYRKQIKNANFISHFFDNGLLSYEMQLDKRRRHYEGVIGVRALLYSGGAKFKDIMLNAYH